jgi:hypothetical protein
MKRISPKPDAPLTRLFAEDAPWCVVWQDGRHGERQVLAAWETPAGAMCNYHTMQGWPDLFITKTIADPAEADADNGG